jgi:4-hydroxybutyrate---CoA ligase (ADP-forming)
LNSRGLLNNHFFKDLVEARKTYYGKKAIEEYAYSSSLDPPELSNGVEAEIKEKPTEELSVSPDIIHKSDAGGVMIGLRTDEEVRAAFKTITDNARKYKADATIKGVLLQEMIKSGKEIILGAKQDPIFGPLIMLGLGGTYIQVFKDVVFRMAPIGRQEGLRMIESIKSIKLLKGVRGEKPSDLKAIVDSLQRLSHLITDFPEIEEFDINPLMVLEEGKGAFTVDVRVGLKTNGHS